MAHGGGIVMQRRQQHCDHQPGENHDKKQFQQRVALVPADIRAGLVKLVAMRNPGRAQPATWASQVRWPAAHAAIHPPKEPSYR